MSNSPFFIIGNPRSGTSLFRLMLNSHPEIIVPPESGFLQWWHYKYNDWNSFKNEDISNVEEYVKDILTSKKIKAWNLDKDLLIKEIISKNPKNYGELSSVIYYCYNISKSVGALIGDKNNYYIHHLNLLRSIYPDSKYIHVVRDGRDVACSYRKINSIKTTSQYKPNLAYNIEEIANEWNNNLLTISNFLRDKDHLVVRYEDLLSDSKKTLKQVCKFLETSFNKEMLEFYRTELMDEPITTIDWKKKVMEPIDHSNTKKYLIQLETHQINDFNRICKKTLIKFGYSTNLDGANL